MLLIFSKLKVDIHHKYIFIMHNKLNPENTITIINKMILFIDLGFCELD